MTGVFSLPADEEGKRVSTLFVCTSCLCGQCCVSLNWEIMYVAALTRPQRRQDCVQAGPSAVQCNSDLGREGPQAGRSAGLLSRGTRQSQACSTPGISYVLVSFIHLRCARPDSSPLVHSTGMSYTPAGRTWNCWSGL